MADIQWNPWKLTALGMALVIVTALVTGLVVAYWTGKPEEAKPAATAPGAPAATAPAKAPTTAPAPGAIATAPGQLTRTAATPSAADVQACNEYAKKYVAGDKTIEVIKDLAIGDAVGAGVGAAGGAIAGGGKGPGKGAAIGGLVGAAAGTLYGVNEANKNDARYVEAYRARMKARGHTG